MVRNRRDAIGMLGAALSTPLMAATSAARAAIVTTPFRIASVDTYPPFIYRKDGKLVGIMLDILDEVIGRQMGIPVEYGAYPWARAQIMVKEGAADSLCTIPTPVRLEYAVASTEPVFVSDFCLFVRKDNPLLPRLKRVKSLSELRSLNPTVVTYLGAGWQTANLTGLDIKFGPTMVNVVDMLLIGRADIVVDGAATT